MRLLAVIPDWEHSSGDREFTEGARLILKEVLAFIDETPPPTGFYRDGETFSEGVARHA
jgi:hypothetical protein